MTYDSSVFSRGNYYKDSFYFKNTKGFRHIFTVNIPLHSKKTFHAASERTTRAAYSLASTQIKASAEASVWNRYPPRRTFGQAKKNSAPETGTGEVSRLVGGLHRQES